MSSVRGHWTVGLLGLGFALALTSTGAGDASGSGSSPKAPDWAASQRRTVLAEGRARPWINVMDGRELPLAYRDAPAGFAERTQSGTFRPTELAAADLDGDGLPDLIAGYAAPRGGWLTLHRGNLDARDLAGARVRSRELGATYSEVPFHPEARVIEVPVAPRFIGTGDFDADGYTDVVVADRVRPELWWLRGSGALDLGTPHCVPLPGAVTALASGEVHRPDGLGDLVVGVRGPESEMLLVFHDQKGALLHDPELLSLPGEIDALVLGDFGDGEPRDLAWASGRVLTLLYGSGSGPFDVAAQRRLELPREVRDLAVGEFADGGAPGLALLLEDGSVQLLGGTTGRAGSPDGLILLDDLVPGSPGTDGLVATNLSNRPGHDLVLYSSTRRRLLVRVGGIPDAAWIELETAAVPAAVLPLQLNDDAFSDLVVLLEGAPAPSVLLTTPVGIFTVDSVGDDPDLDLGDGLCATSTGACTFRAALEQANAAAGTDAIAFDIAGIGPHTIQPLAPLPWVVDPLIIDGTTEPDYAGTPVVEIDGSLAGETDGLGLGTGSSTVRGLAINRFGLSGLVVVGPDAIDNRVQRNHIGTDVTGTTALPNLGNGMYVSQAQGTVIGTDGDGIADAAEGNLISGNAHSGILFIGPDTDGNAVAGNFIGTDLDGTAALGNGHAGVTVWDRGRLNRIGTDGNGVADAEERNVISGNVGQGILLAFGTEEHVVAGNLIGTDASGALPLPNASSGIEISNGARGHRVGSDADGLADDLERNVISGNGQSGIVMFGELPVEQNTIAGNHIGTDLGGTLALANGDTGVSLNDGASDNRIGGGVEAARNLISGNTSNGVQILGTRAFGNRVQGNYLGTDVTGVSPLGNGGQGVFILDASLNVVGTDGDGLDDPGEGNVVSANGSNGVFILGAAAEENTVAGNLLGTSAQGDAALGNGEFGVAVLEGRLNRIGTDGDGVSDVEERNLISGNAVRGVLLAAGTERNVVAGNWIGTDATGTRALPNEGGGVEISNGARSNRIGTDVDGRSDTLERNVISGNTLIGITMFGEPSVDYNVIAGNFIGVQPDGATALPNTTHGIALNAETSHTLIGGLGVTPGSCDGPCNVIAYNGSGGSHDGVRIVAGTGNAVVGNFIYENLGGEGIDIAAAGLTPNDPGDLDGGANNSQNFPILSEVSTAGATTTVQGTLDSLPDTDFHLELFSNATCDSSGYGQGERLVAVHGLTTGNDGKASFTIPVTPAVPDGHTLTITATRLEPGDLPTDTSEFSPCLGAGAAVAAGRVPDGATVPGTPLRLERGVGPVVLLSWGASCLTGDVDYAVYMGDIGDFDSHYARICSTGGLTSAAIRTPQDAIYYLVVPLSATREGSYGTDSDGIERPAGFSACRPQLIGGCP